MRAVAVTRGATKDTDQAKRWQQQRGLMVLVYLASIVACGVTFGQQPAPKPSATPGPKPAVAPPPKAPAPAATPAPRPAATPAARPAVTPAPKPGAKPAAKQQDPKYKPSTVTLKTKDGVDIRAFYFPSEKGKKAPTVLLVHEWQGQASPYAKLVNALNQAGCAVLVPDYRGHGGSREYVDAQGRKNEFNLAQMNRRDIEAIITQDLESAKAFLKKENNAGMLNLNALVVIGVREGSVLGAHWARRDWMFDTVGTKKQGQDVKALVLISPEKNVKGIAIDPVLTDNNILRLPTMIVAGSESPEASEANRVGKRIGDIKRRLGRGEATGYQLSLPNTALSGPSLVNDVPSVIPAIVKFVTSEVVVSDTTNPWVERE